MRTRGKLIEFKAHHVTMMKVQNRNTPIFKLPKLLDVYESLGGSYTFIAGDEVLFCGGVIKYWPSVGEAWLVLSDNANKCNSAIAAIKAFNKEDKNIRTQATIKATDKKAIRFADWLGFKCEGLMKKYGIEGDDYYMYARVR